MTSSSSSLSSWVSLCRYPPSFHRRRSWVLFLRNAWFDSGYMVCDSSLGAFGRASRIFYVEVETRILKSMLSCSPRRGSRSVHSRCFSCIAEVVAHKNLHTTFMSPLYVMVICSPSGRFRSRVFEPSTSHSCELSRARGWRDRR